MSKFEHQTELKKTALFDLHKELRAKIVSFGGWAMPVQYESVITEHNAVRNSCGVFDVSHMGEIFISGSDALNMLQKITINDASKLNVGDGQYTAMLNDAGGIIDDLILYRLAESRYLMCVNAANIEKDTNWIQKQAKPFTCDVDDQSSEWSQLAIQGPESTAAVLALLDQSDHEKIRNLAYMQITEVQLTHNKAFIARTGYTGELGFEMYLSHEDAKVCFQKLTHQNHAKAIGLGARDTLRLESCYLLYGQDMNDQVSPIEAGIGWATKTDKGDFIGRTLAVKHKAKGAERRQMSAFLMEDKGVARSDMDIYWNGRLIGKVTSGSHLPSLNQAGGMALISKDTAKTGDTVEIDVRGKRKLAKLVARPLYSPKVK